MVQEGPIQRREERALPGPAGAVAFVFQPLAFDLEAAVLAREGLQQAQKPFLQRLGTGQALVERQHLDFLEVLQAALGEQVEAAQGLDLVTPQFQAHGVVHPVPEHVDDSAAHTECAHLLAQRLFAVAQAAQFAAQILQFGEVALLQDDRLAPDGARF